MECLDRFIGKACVRGGTKLAFIAAVPWLLLNHFYKPYEICYYTGDLGAVTGFSLFMDEILQSVGKEDGFLRKHSPEISAATITIGTTITELVNTGFNVPDPKDIPAALLGGVIAYIWLKGDKITREREVRNTKFPTELEGQDAEKNYSS